MAQIVLTAESGCDLTKAEAQKLGVRIVPMHVTLGERTIDDGTMPPSEMLEQCRQLGVLPRTSGSTPIDFEAVFDDIHNEHPDAQIVHLAYSAITTCSMESAITAAEKRDYVHMTDTKQVSVGQGLAVTLTARWLREHPEATPEEVIAFADDVASRVHMAFIPGDLGYLRAGGRLSNVAFVGATLLKIKPVIQIEDGKLVATKKLRGSMGAAARKLVAEFVAEHNPDLSEVFLVRSTGLPEPVKSSAEEHARELGFKTISWHSTGNVITSHSGPGTFGLAFVSKA